MAVFPGVWWRKPDGARLDERHFDVSGGMRLALACLQAMRPKMAGWRAAAFWGEFGEEEKWRLLLPGASGPRLEVRTARA